MGYYPSKIACLLNIIIMLGYGMIDCLVGGQVLSAVADGGLTVVVGIIIIAIITWIVVVFGMAPFYVYERWAWVPQLIAIFVLVGSAGPKFDTNISSTGDTQTINANRLTFFSLCLSVQLPGPLLVLISSSTSHPPPRSGRLSLSPSSVSALPSLLPTLWASASLVAR